MKIHLPRFNERSYAYFVTTKTFQNRRVFTREYCCRILLENIEFYRNKLGFKINGYVIMPDHLHLIVWWDVDEQKDLTISKVMHRIKGRSAKHLSDYFYPGRQGLHALPYSRGIQAPTTHKNGIPTTHGIKIWQPSFYDFNIYTEEKLLEKLNYIHYNPVRAGLVDDPSSYPYSSYRAYSFRE